MSLSDEDGTQHGEHVGLDERDQQFEGVHEYEDYHADCAERRAYSDTYLARYKDYARQRQDNGMACHDVGKQTDHQCKRLRQNAEELNDWHQGDGTFEHQWHFGPEDFLPIVSVSEQVDSYERAKCEEKRNGNVSGQVSPAWKNRNQSEQIAEKDEEKRCQQIRCVEAIVLLADVGFNDVVMD